MGKNRDYTKYSKEVAEPVKVNTVETVETTEAVKMVEEPVIEPAVVEEVIAEEPEQEPVIGIVTDCAKLNVREQPSKTAYILGVINAATELVIIEEESTEDYYKICTSAGLEGYCMKKFITIMP